MTIPKSYVNEVSLREQNQHYECYQTLEYCYFGKEIRSFHARNIGSVSQRALKLLAFKVGSLKKKSVISAFTAVTIPFCEVNGIFYLAFEKRPLYVYDFHVFHSFLSFNVCMYAKNSFM